MKITATICISLFLFGSSVGYAETHSSTKAIDMSVATLESWTIGDHLGAAKRYEEESRLLQAEARGMETVEMKILPFLEVDAIKEAGVQNLINRRHKEADENMKLAAWHHKEAMQLLAAKEAHGPTMTSQGSFKTEVPTTNGGTKKASYQKYDWIAEEAILGW
jgi:hypothetical protein